ncbi:MAG TPA: TatD family hydrolase [Kofleriaceae bacterium]|nr:TatD family hydrolase [Kofleriaceae bacterium]
MIDTHCHLDTPAFDDDRDAVIARAVAAGLTGMLVPGIRPRMWDALRTLCGRHPQLRYAIGIHPQVVPDLAADEQRTDLAAWLADAAGDAVAIGECGLDGSTAHRARQEEIFRAHIRAARVVSKPLVVHVLRAHDTASRILREERAHEVGGVMHSYSGSPDLVKVYADLGFAFSFAGPVTYPNARKPVEAARAVPAQLLLAETDAPDQSPRQGTRSEPAFVAQVVAGLAAARGEPVAEVARRTSENARRVFRTW